jgi:hypothetical protein
VHLFGFTIEIYYDAARSYNRRICCMLFFRFFTLHGKANDVIHYVLTQILTLIKFVRYFKISPVAMFVIVAVPAVFRTDHMGMILISHHEKFYVS